MTNSIGSKQDTFSVAVGERQLFVDDCGVARMEHLVRTMHRPDKKGAVIRPADNGRLSGDLQTRNAPIWDPVENVYKLWLLGSGNSYWESKDGLHWVCPYDGEQQRQRCQVETESGPRGIRLVVRDPTDSQRPFKTALPNVGFASSRDGSGWQMMEPPAIRSSDEYNISFDARRHQFLLTFKRRGPYGRCVWLCTSADFTTWSEPQLVFHADDADQLLGQEHIRDRLADQTLLPRYADEPAAYNVDVYNMGAFAYEGLYIGTPAMFHAVAPTPDGRNRVGFHHVQLACSRNLRHWQRLGRRQPFIGPSPIESGAYDLTQIIGPSTPLVKGDELWFYYSGLKYRDDFPPCFKKDADGSAICLAVLRRDGFISLDAGTDEGLLVTHFFEASGRCLCANIDAPEGELGVEVVDERGTTLAVAAPISGDVIRGEFSWQSSSWESLNGRSVALRFRVRQSRFYSYWTE